VQPGDLVASEVVVGPGVRFSVFLSFQSVLQVVLYEQLRAEKEGPDVGQLTAVFE
jgi:hypothetical protein